MSMLSKRYPRAVSFPEGNPFDRETFRKVLPLSILFTAMIATNNLCLKYVSVAFYYVGRSLTTVFNVLLTYALLGQKTSPKACLCCVMIVAGFWIGVDQESLTESFSLIGTVFGVLGSLSLSLYSIHTKRTLQHVNQEVWLLSYYNNVYSAVLFIRLALANRLQTGMRGAFGKPQGTVEDLRLEEVGLHQVRPRRVPEAQRRGPSGAGRMRCPVPQRSRSAGQMGAASTQPTFGLSVPASPSGKRVSCGSVTTCRFSLFA